MRTLLIWGLVAALAAPSVVAAGVAPAPAASGVEPAVTASAPPAVTGLAHRTIDGVAVPIPPPIPVATPVSYAPPVRSMQVLTAFNPPATPYGAGHLGVDLALPSGGVVRSAADGVVSFAGPVAGRGVVVVAHADGIRTEYEPLTPLVTAGQAVARGQPVGTLTGQHASCAPASCVHWGARRGEQYLDPLSLLEPLAPVRLLPWPR